MESRNELLTDSQRPNQLHAATYAQCPIPDRILAPFGRHALDVAFMAERVEGFRNALVELSHGQFHLLGFALSWRAKQGGDRPSLEQLAVAILRMKPRKLILGLAGACPDGLPGCLSKLPAQLMRNDDYLLLFDLLREPRAARVLWHVGRITPDLLALLHRLDPILRVRSFTAYLKTPKAVAGIEYLVAIVLKLDPGLDRVAVLRSLATVTSSQSLETWFTHWLSRSPFPTPPWAGNETLRPLTSAAELFSVALSFRNCLKGRLCNVLGGTAYYYVRTEPPSVVVELIKDPLGLWVLGTIEGVARKKIPHPIIRDLEQQLEGVGYRRVPDFAALPDSVNPMTWAVCPLF